MPDATNCDVPHQYRFHNDLRPVVLVGGISKRPSLAPTHRKPDADILRELQAKLDAELRARNAVVPWQCPGCDFIGDVEVSRTTTTRSIYHIWTEAFELQDPGGNVIKGVGKYMARGEAPIETTVYDRYCDKPFGDDPGNFKDASYSPDKAQFLYIPSVDLDKYWKDLPAKEKLGLKFVKKKKTKK